jgi:thiamine pyrophosphokinase
MQRQGILMLLFFFPIAQTCSTDVHALNQDIYYNMQANDLTPIQLKDLRPQYPIVVTGDETVGLILNGEMPSDDICKISERISKCVAVVLVDGGGNVLHDLIANGHINPSVINPLCLLGDFDSVTKKNKKMLSELYPKMDVVQFRRDKDFTDFEAALKMTKVDTVGYTLVFNALGGRIDQTLGNLFYLFRDDYKDRVQICTANETIGVFTKGYLLDPSWRMVPFYQDNSNAQLYVSSDIEYAKLSIPNVKIFHYEFNKRSIINDLSVILHCAEHPGDFQIQTANETIFAITPKKSCSFSTSIGQTISLIPIKGAVLGIKTFGLHWEFEEGSLESLDKDFIGISNIAWNDKVKISVTEGYLLCIINKFIDADMMEIVKNKE